MYRVPWRIALFGYLVLSHVNAEQIGRLVRRLASTPETVVFVRHDARHHALPPDAFGGFDNVHLVPSAGPVRWGHFDQVQAMLDGIRYALNSGVPFDWLVLLSGQDYPCADLGGFHRALASSRADGFMDYAPIDTEPFARENADRYYFRYVPVPPRYRRLNARLWRLNDLQPFVRFSTSRTGSHIGLRDVRPFVRRTCYRGSFWWALSRPCVVELDAVERTHPELVRAYRQRLHPDESFAQTVLLANPRFAIANDDLRYLRWDDPKSGSPAVLRSADVPALLVTRKPFGRKFDTREDAEVLDRIDEALDNGRAPAPILAPAPGRGPAPKLSIGMPVYNGANYIAEAIRSILAQTFTDFELIVSDNASTDATPDIVAEFAATDPRVRFVRNTRNMGASFNFNRTFELSRGRYFRQAAHDDTLAPECLERCIAVLEADPAVVLAYTRSLCIDEAGNTLAEYSDVMHFTSDDPRERFAAHLQRAFDRSPERNRGSNPACNPIFGIARSDVLRRTPMVGNYIASDMVLLGELALYGKLYEVPETLFYIRAHDGTSWAQNPGIVDVAAWFDPNNRGRMISYMPHVRWLQEYLAAVRRAPLSERDRRGCNALVWSWAQEHRRELVREPLSVAARFCGLRPWLGQTAPRLGPPPVATSG